MLQEIRQAWKRGAIAIGLVQSRILSAVLYVFVMAPFAILLKSLSDPLRLHAGRLASYFGLRETLACGITDGARQY